MNLLPTLLLLLAADDSAKLTLVPNATEILQRDNVMLLSILENKSISAVHIMLDGSDSGGGRIRHEMQDKEGRWGKIRASVDQFRLFCGLRGSFVMQGDSAYAECEAIHRKSLKGAFLFEAPGTYKIRGVVTMPWGELYSEAVTITVKERPLSDLKSIESIPPNDLWSLGNPNLDRALPESLLKVRHVGGNIARTIDQWQMAQAAFEGRVWKGKPIAKERNCQWMRENLDPVAYEHSLDALGHYYVTKKHWDGLPRVVDAMKYDSVGRRNLIYHIKLLMTPPTPAAP